MRIYIFEALSFLLFGGAGGALAFYLVGKWRRALLRKGYEQGLEERGRLNKEPYR